MKKTFGGIVIGLLALFGLSIGFSSCMGSDDAFDPLGQLLSEIEAIDTHLETNNITNVVEDASGIRMVISELGTGLPAMITNSVDVDYVGKLLTTNATFDQGNVKGLLSGYIGGWQIAMTTLPAGSKAKLYIPSYWAYGNSVQGSIPANSTLVFDIDFNDVVESSQELQRLASDTVAIDAYLTSKAINAVKDTTGLRYVITQLGTGDTPTSWYDRVKVKFSYRLLTDDSKVVATIEREPNADFYSRVTDFVHGMKIALQKMPAGSKATLYVPSGLAYGTRGASDNGATVIPANSNLIIDLEFISIVQP